MTTSPPSLDTNTSSEVLKRFDGPSGPEICPGLDRIEAVLARIGSPHRTLPPTIHVAGTNGKGSVVAYLKALLEATGARVHVFNSPHLITIHDGILLRGVPVDDTRLAHALETIEQSDPDNILTSFEALTAAAFLLMAEEPADYAIVEAGLGGKEDATNVLERPAATVLTPIDLDHMEFLGPSIAHIAAHKLGIFKRSVPAIVGPQLHDVTDQIEQTAEQLNVPLFLHNRDWMAFEQHGRMVFQDEKGLLDLSLPPLHGRFQIENAGTAIAVFRQLAPDWQNDVDLIDNGIAGARWPGRLQRLTHGPLVDRIAAPSELWLDGGHNVHAANALSQALADMDERSPLPTHLIIGMRKNKDLAGFLEPFNDLVRGIQAVPLPDPAIGYAAQEIAATALSKGFAVEIAANLEKAVDNLTKDAAQPKRILICGSLLLAGKVLATHG